jgi:nucleoside phosphorylase
MRSISSSRPLPRVLVLSAWEPEIAPLRRLLQGPDAPRALVRATECRAVGVGAVDAAIGAARAMADVEPDCAIFVGTAGVYDRRAALAIGAAVVPDHFLLLSTAALRGDGYLPPPMLALARARSTPRLRQALRRAARTAPGTSSPSSVAALAAALAAAPLAITRTAALARSIVNATGAAVENLEVFAVARAAALGGIDFAAVLGIANHVGPRAHDEWRRHHASASESACAAVWAWLRARQPIKVGKADRD